MGLVAACRYSATCWGLVGSCAGSRRFVENLWRLVVSRGDSRRLAATRGVSWRLVENLWCLVETRGDSRRLAAIRGDSWRLVGGSRGLVLVLFPYWVSPPWPCLGFGPRPGVRGVSRRCLASCLFLVVLLGVVSRLDYGVPAASGLGRGLLPFVLGLGLSGSSCVVVLLLSGIVSPLRPLLGCLGSGRVLSSPPPPSSWSLSPLFAVTLETRVALLARCWLAAGSHVELYDSVQRNRVRRCWAVVGFTPSTRLLLPGSVWVDLGFCPPCLDHTRCLLEARPVPGSSRSVLSGHVPFSPSLSSLVRLSSWLVLPLHALPHPGRLDLSPSGSLEGSLRAR